MTGNPSLDLEVSGSHAIFRLPQRLGKYTLTKRLGAGGMAEVFLAQQDGAAGFQKQCVVKRILPHLAEEPRFVQMFQREAKIAALLSHTNIAQIYELSEVDGIYYIAMEYVDGAPLNRLARAAWRAKRALPLEVASCAVADAALGLHAAHQQKSADGQPLRLVHRDISPDNLIVNREGVTKILDFGVAKSALVGERTATGELKGKIPFLSPEQIRGDDVDGRADIYALGVTFYWLLTGKRPFSAPTDLALIQVVLAEEPKPPRAINPTIPEAVDDLIRRMLAKDRDDRPSTGADVHDRLAAATSARRSIVVPFVNTILELPDERGDETVTLDIGFVPSSPMSDVRFDPVTTPFRPTRARSHETTADTGSVATSPAPSRRVPVGPLVVGGGVALALAASAVLYFGPPGAPPKLAHAADAGPVVAAPVVVPPVVAPPVVAPPAVPPPVVPPPVEAPVEAAEKPVEPVKGEKRPTKREAKADGRA